MSMDGTMFRVYNSLNKSNRATTTQTNERQVHNMRIHLNNATVRVSGFENKKSFSHIYHNVTCIEEVTAKEIEKECGEKIGACIRLHFEDGKTATFSKKSKLDYEVL